MNRHRQFDEGYRDYLLGITLSDSPYDRASQPEQYKSWRAGWKQAKFDNIDNSQPQP